MDYRIEVDLEDEIRADFLAEKSYERVAPSL
jgi:hypothetical protein